MIELDDDGYVEVTVRTAGGEPKPVRVDLYDAVNAYNDCHRRHGDDPLAFNAAWAAWLEKQGLPRLSTKAAAELWRRLGEAFDALKKPAPGSPSAG